MRFRSMAQRHRDRIHNRQVRNRKHGWHRWYAWRPVWMGTLYTYVWLEWIERHLPTSTAFGARDTEYRPAQPKTLEFP